MFSRGSNSRIHVIGQFLGGKVTVRLDSAPANHGGPINSSQHNHIKLIFRSGGEEDVCLIFRIASYYYFSFINGTMKP